MDRRADDTATASVFLRPLGNPLPLGFVGLAVATSVMASFNLGWIPTAEQHQVAFVLIAFAFPLQMLATVLLFLARDAPSGAAIGVQSVTWLVLGLLLYSSRPGSVSATAGIFLFAAAGALVPSATTTTLSKVVPGAIMLGTTLRFVLTGLYEKLGSAAWQHAAGWEGVVLAGAAIYAALASDLESSFKRSLLPLGRLRPPSREGLSEQWPELEWEPGVRREV